MRILIVTSRPDLGECLYQFFGLQNFFLNLGQGVGDKYIKGKCRHIPYQGIYHGFVNF